MKIIVVSQDMVDGIHEARLLRWGKLDSRTQARKYAFGKNFGFYAVCEGCLVTLKVCDNVIEFRKQRFVHDTLVCIDKLSPFSITRELRKYATPWSK